jgi:hypothetical protein
VPSLSVSRKAPETAQDRPDTPSPAVRIVNAGDTAAPSPAVALQHGLEQHLRNQAAVESTARWPVRRTLAFSGSIGLALWAALAAIAFSAFK